MPRSKTSTYRGVSRKGTGARVGAWLAQMVVAGVYHRLGVWDDEDRAAIAWDRAALHFGLEDALNLPRRSRRRGPASPQELRHEADMLHKARSKVSRFRGLYWDAKAQAWCAYVPVDGRTVFVGSFDDEQTAAVARDRAAIQLLGRGTKLNFPDAKLSPASVEQIRNEARGRKPRTSRFWGTLRGSGRHPWLAYVYLYSPRAIRPQQAQRALSLGAWATEELAAIAHDRAALQYVTPARRHLNFPRRRLQPATVFELRAEARLAYKRRFSSSLFRGVTFDKASGRWAAIIRVDGVNRRLGYFEDEEAAAEAYDVAARVAFGSEASFNFHPKTGEPLYGQRLGGPLVRKQKRRQATR